MGLTGGGQLVQNGMKITKLGWGGGQTNFLGSGSMICFKLASLVSL